MKTLVFLVIVSNKTSLQHKRHPQTQRRVHNLDNKQTIQTLYNEKEKKDVYSY